MRSKRLLLTLWFAVALALAACGGEAAVPPTAAPVASIAADSDNNEIPTLTNGQAVQGMLTGNTTAQLYAFNATAGNVVTLSMVPVAGSSLDPYLVVLNSAGGFIASDNNSGEVELSAAIETRIPTDGTYFVIAASSATIDGVQSETIDGSQSYALELNGAALPPGQGARVLYFREPLTYNTPPSERGYSSPLEPVYYYTFQGSAGEVVEVVMNSLNFDAMLSLYDPNGNRIAVNDDARTVRVTSTTDAVLENVTLPTDGTYIIMATSVAFTNVIPDEYDAGFFDIVVNRLR